MRLSSIAVVGGDGLGPWGVSDEVQKGWETRIPLAMSPYLENGEAPCPWVSLWSLRERESGRRGWVTHIHLSSLSLETPGHLLPASQSSLQTLPPEETGFIFVNCLCWVSLVAQIIKCLPAVQDTRVQSLGQEDPLQKGMATHSNTLAWKIPWTEEPGGLQSMGLQRVGHD